MSKITFDGYGNPAPYKVVNFTVDECEKYFVTNFTTSSTRPLNWKKYNVYTHTLKNHLMKPLVQWLAGSFTTTKVDPDDIDLVNFIEHDDFKKDLELFDMNRSNQFPKKQYNIDGYNVLVFPKQHPYYVKLVERKKYWTEVFASDRANNPKALIEVTYT